MLNPKVRNLKLVLTLILKQQYTLTHTQRNQNYLRALYISAQEANNEIHAVFTQFNSIQDLKKPFLFNLVCHSH